MAKTSLSVITAKNMECDGCSLRGRAKIYPAIPTDFNGILFVGAFPTVSDITNKATFTGPNGKILRKALELLGVIPEQCLFTNLLRCTPPGMRDPSVLELTQCSGHVIEEINRCNPTKIICLGKWAARMFLDSTVSKTRGLEHDFQGRALYVTYDPTDVLTMASRWVDLFEDLEKYVNFIPFLDTTKLSNYIIVDNEIQALNILKWINPDEAKQIDFETGPGNPYRHLLDCVGIKALAIEEVFIFPFETMGTATIDAISALPGWGGWNVDYEYRWWKVKTGKALDFTKDGMLYHHYIDMRFGAERALKKCGTRYFGVSDWSDKVKEYGTDYGKVPKDILYPYLSWDCNLNELLLEKWKDTMPESLRALLHKTRRVLSEMSLTGMPIDSKYAHWAAWTSELAMEALQENIQKELQQEEIVNVRSTKGLASLLFEELDLPRLDGNKANKVILAKLASTHPEHKEVLEAIAKMRIEMSVASVNIDKYYAMQEADGRLHGLFTMTSAETGRLASVNPNLQNIPVRTHGKFVRDLFIPPSPDHVMVDIDYSQIEVFLGATVAKDKEAIKLLNSGYDLYQETASMFYKVEYAAVTKKQRQSVKPVVLGAIFDRTAWAIAQEWGRAQDDTQKFLDEYFERFQGFKNWLTPYDTDKTALKENPDYTPLGAEYQALSRGYSETMYGRRRYFPIRTGDSAKRIRRQTINTPIQGTASDVNNEALCLNDSYFRDRDRLDDCRLFNIIHDCQCFFIKKNVLDECIHICCDNMINGISIDIPLTLRVEIKVGERWGSMEDYSIKS